MLIQFVRVLLNSSANYLSIRTALLGILLVSFSPIVHAASLSASPNVSGNGAITISYSGLPVSTTTTTIWDNKIEESRNGGAWVLRESVSGASGSITLTNREP